MNLNSLSTGARIGGLLGALYLGGGVGGLTLFCIEPCVSSCGQRVSSSKTWTWSETFTFWGLTAAAGLVGASLGGIAGHLTEATVKLAFRILIKH